MKKILLILLLFCGVSESVNGQMWNQLGKDIDGEAADDQSGRSVALSSDGKTLAIGAPYNNGNGENSGQVRIYSYNGISWKQLGKDINGEAADDYSGSSVALSGDGKILAIGAPLNDENGENSGQVRIYSYNGSIWKQLGQDIDGEAAYDMSGKSVAISSDAKTLAIGAPYNNGNGDGSGHVRIYSYNGSIWKQLGQDIDGEAAYDMSGSSVAISSDGKTLAIGAEGNDVNGLDAGHVRIYTYNGSRWKQLGQDINGEAAGDYSGNSVAISSDGKTLAIGAPNNNNVNGDASGHVRVYQIWAKIIAEKKDPELFLPKDEFETIAEYVVRKQRQNEMIDEINEQLKKEEIAKQKEQIRLDKEKLAESLEKITFYPSLIGTYNAENETFTLTVNKKQYTVSVPRSEARTFKENYSKASVDVYKQLKEDLLTYEYFNFVVTHPVTGSKYKFGPEKVISGTNISTIASSDKKVIPPNLNMKVVFEEPSGNSFLDAEETGSLSIKISNSGKGSAMGVVVMLKAISNNEALKFDNSKYIGEIPAGETRTAKFEINASKKVKRMENQFLISVKESYGFPPESSKLSFETYPLILPEISLSDYGVSSAMGNKINPGVVAEVQVRIQNKGQGIAKDITFSITLPQGVYPTPESKEKFTFSSIEPGQYKDLGLSFTPNKNVGSVIELTIGYLEKSTSGSFSLKLEVEVDKAQKSIQQLVVKGKEQDKILINDIPDIMVDVDKDIPSSSSTQQHTYALIIGNEDYQSKQKGLSTEQNVPFAENDAQVFAQYCEKTLGIPKKNIKLLINAGSIEMKQAIEWANYMAEINNGKAKLIFYYSGHGLPDDNKQPHLMPVNVSGLSLNYAVKLNDVYNQLTEHPTQQVSVFLDACFSGGARNQGLVAMKSLRVKPKEESFAGNMVVFASSSGDETSAVYNEKQHGFFTYFLLKKLQQTKGATDLKALSDYIYNYVRLEAGHIGKIQTPQVNASSAATDKWEDWKLK